jgi:uncharacterized protein
VPATREDHTFASGDETCAAWVYWPPGPGAAGPDQPVVVMGHGLGGVRQMGLDRYAERFAAEGIIAIVFDYRYFGASSGEPRQLLSVGRQLEDWDAAIAFAAALPGADPARIAIWGSSFGGGHVLSVASRHPELAAVVSQCPFTDGLSSTFALGIKSLLKVAPLAVRDEFAALTRRPPVRVPLAGPPGSAALMSAPDALPGYQALVPDGQSVDLTVSARIGSRIGLYNPGRSARKVTSPLMVNACEKDTVAPIKATLRHVRKAPSLELRTYDRGHFDIYVGPGFAEVVEDQVAFLRKHLLP